MDAFIINTKCTNCLQINTICKQTISYRCLICLQINCTMCKTVHDSACEMFHAAKQNIPIVKGELNHSELLEELPSEQPREKKMRHTIGGPIQNRLTKTKSDMVKPYNCDLCAKPLSSRKSYSRHLRTKFHLRRLESGMGVRASSADTVVLE